MRSAALALLLAWTPALAVGLGPLKREGVTDGPGKAFYLTLSNPYPLAERFQVEPVGLADDDAAPRVTVFPDQPVVGAGGARRLLVIVRPLQPGETYTFRVCAQRAPRPEETVHARVCSKLAARRLPARA